MIQKVPFGWTLTEIKTIGEVITGNTPSKAIDDYYGGDIPWVKPGDVNKGTVIDTAEETLTDLGASKSRLLPKGSVMVTCIGNLGNVAIAGRQLATNQQINSIIPNTSLVEPKYCYYWSLMLKPWLIANSTSTTISMVNKSNFEKAPFLFPPLAEQKRIVAKLDEAFKHLEILKSKLERIPELLKKFRQTVLTHAVTGKLTEEWRKGKKFSESGGKFVDRVLSERLSINPTRNIKDLSSLEENFPFEVPQTWTFTSLANLGELTRGKSKHRPRNDERLFSGPYPFIQTGDVARADWLINAYSSTYSEFGLKQSRLFPKGTLCITIAANIADTAILGFDACFPDSVVGFIPFRDQYKAEFAMYFINTIQKDLEQYAPATAQKNINLQVLNEVLFPVPPKEELDVIVERVECFFEIVQSLERRYNLLKQKIDVLPQVLLTKVFRGGLTEKDFEKEQNLNYELEIKS